MPSISSLTRNKSPVLEKIPNYETMPVKVCDNKPLSMGNQMLLNIAKKLSVYERNARSAGKSGSVLPTFEV